MRDLFQELYNKVLSLFTSTKDEIDPAKKVALNRLKAVLMQDRAGFSERAIQALKEELVVLVSKYMDIETEGFGLEINAKDNGSTVLNLSIPVIRPKTDEEIDATIREQEIVIQKKAREIVRELESLIKERAQAMTEGEIDPALIEEAAKKVSLDVKDDNENAENEPKNKEKEDKKDDLKENIEA